MSISAKNILYQHANNELLFQHISFNIEKRKKIALIGANGSGKSTLLKLVFGITKPSQGFISVSEKPYYVPQHFGQFDQLTVSQTLQIDSKLKALRAIENGDISQNNFTVLNDDWNIEERVETIFEKWNLSRIKLSQKMKELSGGEKTKVFLAGINLHETGILLLDEPSNHLDTESRKQLYQLIQQSKATILVVSHDRKLLELVDAVYELSRNGIEIYGGNYSFYSGLKQHQLETLEQQLKEKEKELLLSQKQAQQTNERQQKHSNRGKKSNAEKGIPRIVLNSLQDKSEKSASKLKQTHNKIIENLKQEIEKINSKIPESKQIHMRIETTKLHHGKILISANEINFCYENKFLWKQVLNFQIRSHDRIAISGVNGSGKTTLLKILIGDLRPQIGSINRSECSTLYIDQEYAFICNELTVYEQVQQYNNRNLHENEVKNLLTKYLFGATSWNKKCQVLSGGEKMKLIFCCMQANDNIPDIIILDEPTNNLDLQSIETITNVIKNYKGSLLVVSHDTYFLNEIGIENTIELI